jgi:hypothetical protein
MGRLNSCVQSFTEGNVQNLYFADHVDLRLRQLYFKRLGILVTRSLLDHPNSATFLGWTLPSRCIFGGRMFLRILPQHLSACRDPGYEIEPKAESNVDGENCSTACPPQRHASASPRGGCA